MNKTPSDIKPESWLVAAGRASEPGAPLNVPPIPASNFIIGKGREYSRDDGTPTWEALEEVVGGLESGKSVAFASGMAAIAAVFDCDTSYPPEHFAVGSVEDTGGGKCTKKSKMKCGSGLRWRSWNMPATSVSPKTM